MPISDELRAAERRLAEMVNRRADAEQADLDADQRSQAMADAQARQDLQARFQGTFEPYGEMAPPAIADESPVAYHRRLLHAAQRKLSPSDDRHLSGTHNMKVGDLARVPIDELTRTAREAFDPLFHQAASLQSDTPHVSTLPPPGEFVERHRVDEDTGQKSTVWFGRESFIKSLNRPGQMVTRIMDPGRGLVLWGKPFDRMPS